MILVKFGILILNFINIFLKLLPTKNKVTMISRQSNDPSLDFKLIEEEIKRRDPSTKVVILCHKLDGGIKSTFKTKIKYGFHMFKQMYNIATSKTVILDSYCMVISILKNKKSLKVIQIWHSMGAIKKFGYQTLDKEYGNSSKVAKVMKMHNNYNIIVSGSKAMVPYFSKAFNAPKEKFITCGLPKVDYLIKNEQELKEKIYNLYPEIKDKKVILYVPTFRKGEDYYTERIVNAFSSDEYELIIKGHPLKKYKNQKYNMFSSLDLLTVADYVITDYSGISIEAAVLNKPILFYLYDLDDYEKKVGLNIDLLNEMPTSSSKELDDIVNVIKNNKYNYSELKRFRKKYIDNLNGNATEIIVNYVVGDL